MASTRSPRIAIRRAEEHDVAKLTAVLAPDLNASQVDHRWQEHKDGYREMLTAELDGVVAGTVSTTGHRFQLPDSLRMFALDVGPAFRRQGVGTALIEAVEEMARLAGLGNVNLEVTVDNPGALRLYERLGYHRMGEPVTDRWERPTEGGNSEQIEEVSWVMIKSLGAPSKP